MAIDRNKLSAIIAGKARALCSLDGERIIDQYDKKNYYKQQGGINPLKTLNESDDYYGGVGLGMESYEDTAKIPTDDIVYDSESITNSKIPNKIKESFLKQRIDTAPISVLDEMSINASKQQINENKPLTQSQPQYNSNINGIDYSIIRAIVNECLKEHLSKTTLNENTSLQTIVLKEGNISLVDNKGNIYKAKLEKIGNKNDKK